MLPSEQLDTELIESACRRAGKTQESHSHPELVLLEGFRLAVPGGSVTPAATARVIRTGWRG
jgi:hypothetical protein